VHPNTHVFWVGKEETTRGYGFHIYHPSGYKQFDKHTVPVTYYQGHWHILKHEKATKRPILGARRDDIAEFDEKLQQDTQESEDTIEEEDSLEIQIRNAPLPPELSPSISMATQTQTATTTVSTILTATTSPNDLREKLRKALKRSGNPGGPGGPGGGPPGPGGSPSGGPGGNPPGGGGNPGQPNPNANPQQPIPLPNAADVKVRGGLPDVFDGDRTKADKFLREFKAYLRANSAVAGFNSPFHMIATALTLIKGPLVDNWAEDMGEWLDTLNMPADNIPALWDEFEAEFRSQYQDSQRAQKAKNRLEGFRMKWPEVDQYISDFEQLCREANYTQGEESTSQMFLKGLPYSVQEKVLENPNVQTYEQMKEMAKQAVRAKQLIETLRGGTKPNQGKFQNAPRGPWNRPINQGPRPPFFQQNRANNAPRPQRFNSTNAPRWMNNQPVPMDVDLDRARAGRNQPSRGNVAQTNDNWRQNRPQRPNPSGNACFECGQLGHYARNCPQKRRAQVNLIDWEQDGEEPPDKISEIKAQLASLSPEEQGNLADQLAQSEDFLSA
jgi:hypothetical protein